MSGTSNLTAGVVGCGRMGAFSSESMRVHGPDSYFPLAHAEAIEAAEGLDLVALCDSNGDSLSRAGERYGVERKYADYRRMLAAGAPDLLGIATRARCTSKSRCAVRWRSCPASKLCSIGLTCSSRSAR